MFLHKGEVKRLLQLYELKTFATYHSSLKKAYKYRRPTGVYCG